jgi:hypothetical protein
VPWQTVGKLDGKTMAEAEAEAEKTSAQVNSYPPLTKKVVDLVTVTSGREPPEKPD